MSPLVARCCAGLGLVSVLAGCGDRAPKVSDSGRSASLPAPVPVNVTNWDTEAGPVMVFAREGDSVALVLPQATDSTLPFHDSSSLGSDLTVDLFGRAGKVASARVVTPLARSIGAGECPSWPGGRMKSPASGWRVGFVTGRVAAVPLDSIEGKSSVDSAALVASIGRSAAQLPSASDSDFRGLPFRVRSAHTFRTDSIEVLIADIVRSIAEEANPRLEHHFVIAERPAKSTARYRVAFFSRTAGAEDEAEITELLAVVLVGPERRRAIVVNTEHDEGRKLGLLERTAPGQWRFRWRSAYTGC